VTTIDDAEVERRIEELFQANYKRMLAEGGAHILTPRALDQAREQVLHYWRRLREIAISVTETEVRLQLPNRVTKQGRRFVIEGVVDLVREADKVRMYDIKTHYCGEVRKKIDSYAAQLNLYAYIWRELRGQQLHEMGVIAIQLPEGLREALRLGDADEIKRHFEGWNPLVPIPFSRDSVELVFEQIADTVDKIEDGTFAPPPVERLRNDEAKEGTRPILFATLHCRNCDGRFSCDSYREYVEGGGARGRAFDVKRYLEAAKDDGELEAWVDGNIELDLDRLFPEGDGEQDVAPRGQPPAKKTRRRGT
jgi:hypothetical protein